MLDMMMIQNKMISCSTDKNAVCSAMFTTLVVSNHSSAHRSSVSEHMQFYLTSNSIMSDHVYISISARQFVSYSNESE